LGFAPDPAGKAYSTIPNPLAGIKGTYFQGKGKGAGREWDEKYMKAREKARGEEGKGVVRGGSPVCICRIACGRRK